VIDAVIAAAREMRCLETWKSVRCSLCGRAHRPNYLALLDSGVRPQTGVAVVLD
jgi:hypothetical protein